MDRCGATDEVYGDRAPCALPAGHVGRHAALAEPSPGSEWVGIAEWGWDREDGTRPTHWKEVLGATSYREPWICGRCGTAGSGLRAFWDHQWESPTCRDGAAESRIQVLEYLGCVEQLLPRDDAPGGPRAPRFRLDPGGPPGRLVVDQGQLSPQEGVSPDEAADER